MDFLRSVILFHYNSSYPNVKVPSDSMLHPQILNVEENPRKRIIF